MTVIKRCEKEVIGSGMRSRSEPNTGWTLFLITLVGACPVLAALRSTAPSTTTASDGSTRTTTRMRPRSLNHQLIDRVKADVALCIHGYNTCAVSVHMASGRR